MLITKQILSVRNRIDLFDSNQPKNEYSNNVPNWVDYIAETLLNRVSLSLLVSFYTNKKKDLKKGFLSSIYYQL